MLCGRFMREACPFGYVVWSAIEYIRRFKSKFHYSLVYTTDIMDTAAAYAKYCDKMSRLALEGGRMGLYGISWW